MLWPVPALCLRVCTELLRATLAVLIFGAVLSRAEHPQAHAPQAAREDSSSIAASSVTRSRSQPDKSPLLLGTAPRPRLERSSDRCPSQPITASSIGDIAFLSPEELELCLSSAVLVENLEAVLDEPVTTQMSQILKKKLDEFFSSGIPEKQLRRLGTLSCLYTVQEISRWQVTSNATLLALLSPTGRCWNDSQVQQLLSRFLTLGGSWSGALLQEMGGKVLCQLREEQIQQIPAAAIGTAGQLNISTCSQSKKEQLYGKAREAFGSLGSSPSSYYCRIRPYLGGAPAEDLKGLANAGVAINMDLDTFLALNPEELQKLSILDVKHLLGENLPQLKKAEHAPSVQSWLQKQFQQELDRELGIGLQGGRLGTASPATATVTSPAPATVTSLIPSTATSTDTATTPAGVTSPVPTTLASVTSTTPVPTPTTLPTVPTPPRPSPSVTVPTPSSHSPPQLSVVSPSIPTPSDMAPHTGGPPVPSATPPARPSVPSAPPCPTQQPDRATSPTVPILSTLLATSSPRATPGAAVTSGATTGAGAGTDLAGATHSTVTTVPKPSSAPTATPVPNPTSAPTVTSVPNPSSSPTATHSTATTVPKPSCSLTDTPVPKPSSATTVTSVPKPSSVPTATPVPNPSSPATPVPNPSSSPTVTLVPHSSSAATATHSTVTAVPNPSSVPTVPPVPNPTSAPTVPESPSVPAATTAAPSATPIPNSTASSPKPSQAVPCQPSSPPGPPSPTATPGNVPEPPRPTSNGFINLQPPAGSGSRLCSCLVALLAATTVKLLLL